MQEMQEHINRVRGKFTNHLDTGTPSGRFFLRVIASIAGMEPKRIIKRTCARLEVAKPPGRKPKMTDIKTESAKK
ncbi:MAG TPA: hypothetical protein ACQGQH_04100 [Xylella sp.]